MSKPTPNRYEVIHSAARRGYMVRDRQESMYVVGPYDDKRIAQLEADKRNKSYARRPMGKGGLR